MQRQYLLVCSLLLILPVTGCRKSVPAPSDRPIADSRLSPKTQEAISRKGIEVQIYQINQSKLPPEQKQRLIEQVRSAATK